MKNLKFTLKKEVELDEKLQPISKEKVVLYANCDSASAYITEVSTYSEALELIQPDKIRKLLKRTMSGDEYEIFEALLSTSPKYYFLNKEFEYKA